MIVKKLEYYSNTALQSVINKFYYSMLKRSLLNAEKCTSRREPKEILYTLLYIIAEFHILRLCFEIVAVCMAV
jgi:hypothetical protein